MEEFDPQKIVNPELREFAACPDCQELVSVIIELGVPPTPRAPRSISPPLPPPKLRQPLEASGLPEVEAQSASMDQMEKELAALNLQEEPVRLEAAQAFVVNVNSAQLRAITRLPLAGIIRPNRPHFV